MGRSRGAFIVPNQTAAALLVGARAWGDAHRMTRPLPEAPNQLVLSRGSENFNGRWMIVLTAWDVQGGANLALEAWTVMASWGELNANPHEFVAALPKRRLNKLLVEMLGAIGVRADRESFQHTG